MKKSFVVYSQLASMFALASLAPACVADADVEAENVGEVQSATTVCPNILPPPITITDDADFFGPNRKVDFDNLPPGSTVQIRGKDDGAPYKVKFVITSSGGGQCPIRIQGVRGNNGKFPIIDGNGATQVNLPTDSEEHLPHPNTPQLGVVQVAQRNGNPAYNPHDIVIENLEIIGGRMGNFFTRADRTAPVEYAQSAASLYIMGGQHITVRGCDIHGSGNGLLVNSNSGYQGFNISSDIHVENNYFHDNGTIPDPARNISGDREHNLYTEADGITVEFNRFERLIPGAIGNNFKDRSLGTVFRYNYVLGGARMLDLVEPQESEGWLHQHHRFPLNANGVPENTTSTYVYGNVLILENQENSTEKKDGTDVIHYGGDQTRKTWNPSTQTWSYEPACNVETEGDCGLYRKGDLFYYNNTVIIDSDRSEQHYYTSPFKVDRGDAHIKINNNIIYHPYTYGWNNSYLVLLSPRGTADLGQNLISTPYWLAKSQVDGQLYTDSVDPGFVNYAAKDLHLAYTSACIDAGDTWTPPPGYELTSEYVMHQSSRTRPTWGPLDLGAFEATYECRSNADCRLQATYCDSCQCAALASGESVPACQGTTVQCYQNPCNGKTAACVSGQCVVSGGSSEM